MEAPSEKANKMNDKELLKKVKEKYHELKNKSGSHSPSIMSLQREIPEIKVEIDCCYLSNPYATEVFMERFKKLINDDKLMHTQIESYPLQNAEIAEDVSKATGVKRENIFIGNGATEIISAILNKFVQGKLLIMIPTFSPYYEYANKKTTTIHYYPLHRDKDMFTCDLDDLLRYCILNKINNMVIINPNNPDGSLITKSSLKDFLEKFSFLDNLILDESFIEFAGTPESLIGSFHDYRNLTIIRSMSKVFGIAGIRAGYCVTKAEYVKELLEEGYLWNSNCFAIYFFHLLTDKSFMDDYQVAKTKYNEVLAKYYEELLKCNPKIKFYKSKANFFLGEIVDKNLNCEDLMLYLLVEHGIYIRMCYDKVGLDNKFFRISCRNEEDNAKIIAALKEFK